MVPLRGPTSHPLVDLLQSTQVPAPELATPPPLRTSRHDGRNTIHLSLSARAGRIPDRPQPINRDPFGGSRQAHLRSAWPNRHLGWTSVATRSIPARGAARALRGLVLTATSASLSVAAHAAAGGSTPDLGTTILITALLSGAGLALADRRRGLWSIVGAVGVGQVSLHLFLQLAASHSDSAPLRGLPLDPVAMTLGHVLAGLLVAVLLHRAEDALFVIVSTLRLTLPRKMPAPLPPVTTRFAICLPAEPLLLIEQLIRQRIHALRGPPEPPNGGPG